MPLFCVLSSPFSADDGNPEAAGGYPLGNLTVDDGLAARSVAQKLQDPPIATDRLQLVPESPD